MMYCGLIVDGIVVAPAAKESCKSNMSDEDHA